MFINIFLKSGKIYDKFNNFSFKKSDLFYIIGY